MTISKAWIAVISYSNCKIHNEVNRYFKQQD